MKILLVEDEPVVAQTLSTGLERWNIEVILAQQAEQALEVLTNEQIDLLVTDLVMPGMSGIELVRKLRQTEHHRDLPVLMMSGQADRQDIIEANELNIQGFMAKPFKPDDLGRRILAVFKERKHQLRGQQIQALWENRQLSFNDIVTPQVVFGEPLSQLEDLWRPENRSMVAYLNNAREAMAELNAAHDMLDLGYVIEDNTADIIIPLVRHAAKKWIKPVLLVRLFAINGRGNMPVFLVYDHLDELTPDERKGLKKLGVKLLKRSSLDRERMKKLIDKYVVKRVARRAKAPEDQPLSPQELRERIIEDIDAMITLPALPQVYERILTLSRDPDSDLKGWIRTIKVDPLTCAVILRHANSLSYGFTGRINEIDRAVILLGKNAISALVASEAMRQTFTAVQEQGFDLEDFWLHNLAVGFAAYILSFPLKETELSDAQERNFSALDLEEEAVDQLRRIDLAGRLNLDYARENPFVGGIMHDLGKGVMILADAIGPKVRQYTEKMRLSLRQ